MKPQRTASLLLVLALLAGCASQPVPPARVQRAIAENNRGEQLYARGEYAQALTHFQKALVAAETIEDEDAIAANLLSAAAVHLRLGDRKAAIAGIDRILNEANLRFPPVRLADAALRRAMLALDEGDRQGAQEWTVWAESHCGQACSLRATLLNARGHIALVAGDATAAERWAVEAVVHARANLNRPELANSLRLLGAAALLGGRAGQALAPLQEALAIDRELALPRAIVNDLITLGRVHADLGDAGLAKAFFERAQAAATADGNLPAMEQAKRALAASGERR